jgi:hypothetical protein
MVFKWSEHNGIENPEGIMMINLSSLINAGKIMVTFLFLFVYSYVHTLFGPFLPQSLAPSLFPTSFSLSSRIYSALFSNFVEERT